VTLYTASEKEDLISQELVKALFSYSSETGIFTRKLTTGQKAQKGSIAGSLQPSGYILLEINGNTYRAHRVAWLYMYGEFPDRAIDHIDRDRANNSIANLRLATAQENIRNSGLRTDNSTGYRGVSLDKRSGRYRAYIYLDGKQKSLGYHSTAEDAAAAYNEAAKKLFGEFKSETISIG
jgi:hypothetical protein